MGLTQAAAEVAMGTTASAEVEVSGPARRRKLIGLGGRVRQAK